MNAIIFKFNFLSLNFKTFKPVEESPSWVFKSPDLSRLQRTIRSFYRRVKLIESNRIPENWLTSLNKCSHIIRKPNLHSWLISFNTMSLLEFFFLDFPILFFFSIEWPLCSILERSQMRSLFISEQSRYRSLVIRTFFFIFLRFLNIYFFSI